MVAGNHIISLEKSAQSRDFFFQVSNQFKVFKDMIGITW